MTGVIMEKQANEQVAEHQGIDEELLAEVQRDLPMATRPQAINAALRAYVEARREQRGAALDEMQRMAAEGLIDFDAIDEVGR